MSHDESDDRVATWQLGKKWLLAYIRQVDEFDEVTYGRIIRNDDSPWACSTPYHATARAQDIMSACHGFDLCDSAMPVDDNDVLRAVMAFLDGQDDENEHQNDDNSTTIVPREREKEVPVLAPLTSLNSDTGIGSPSPAPSDAESTGMRASNTASTSTKTYPRVINRSRMRRRHEVLSLREQVVALQERLGVIHRRRDTQGDDDGVISTETDPSDSEHLSCQQRVAAWQAVAESQRDQLHNAERERDKLRALVREYKLSIRRVDRFLQKHTPVRPATFTRAEQLLAYNVVDLESTSDGFEEISCNLPTMYLQINGVFKDARLDSLVDGLRDIQVQNETTPHMSIETLESRVLPFDVASTAKAVWKFHQVKAQTVILVVNEQLEQSEDTLRRTFLATLELPNYKGRARGRMETRRFVERDRVVIVQCAIFDRTERLAGKYVEGFGVRQFHWTVIGPPRNEKLRQCGRSVSQIETFEVGLPFRESSSRRSVDPKRDQEEMKQFCVEAAEVVLEMESQAVENILVNLSLGL